MKYFTPKNSWNFTSLVHSSASCIPVIHVPGMTLLVWLWCTLGHLPPGLDSVLNVSRLRTRPRVEHWKFNCGFLLESGQRSTDWVFDQLFFSAMYNPYNVLHRLLPQSKDISYNLHKRTHNLTLPTDINAVMKQNFVFRMLFTDIY